MRLNAGYMQLSGVRLSVCPFRLPLHAATAGLLLRARRPGDIDGLLHGLRAGGQQQQMRAVPRCQPTQEAEHRLVVITRLLCGSDAVCASEVCQCPVSDTPRHE